MDNKKEWQKKDESFTKKLGDKVERAGEKISEKAPGIGKSVRDLGDKIEHSQEKNPSKE